MVKTFNGTTIPFTSGTFTDATGSPSAFYSYSVCVYTGSGTLAASYTHPTSGFARARRTTGAYIMFINNSTVKGNVTPATADATCQTSGNSIISGKTWKAVLSTGSTLASRLGLLNGYDVRNLAGDLVAPSTNFVNGGSATNAVSYTESFSKTTASVWTGFTSSGATSTNNCTNWTNNTGGKSGVIGLSGSTSGTWLSGTSQSCNKLYGFYCISTSSPD